MFGDEKHGSGSFATSDGLNTQTVKKDFEDPAASFYVPTSLSTNTPYTVFDSFNLLPEQNPPPPAEPVSFQGVHHFANEDGVFSDPTVSANGQLPAASQSILFSNFQTSTHFTPNQDAGAEPHDGQEHSMSSFTKSSSLSMHSEGEVSNSSGETSQDVHANDVNPADLVQTGLFPESQNGPKRPSYLVEKDASLVSNSVEVNALLSEIEELRRSKEEVEKELLLKATSVKQYDLYCQSLVSCRPKFGKNPRTRLLRCPISGLRADHNSGHLGKGTPGGAFPS
jgi:hypothetical protein